MMAIRTLNTPHALKISVCGGL